MGSIHVRAHFIGGGPEGFLHILQSAAGLLFGRLAHLAGNGFGQLGA